MSRPYDPRSTPQSTISPWPVSIAARTRSCTVHAGTLNETPRACQTMQYVQRWLQPSCTLMNARARSIGASCGRSMARDIPSTCSAILFLVRVGEDRIHSRVCAGIRIDAAAGEHDVCLGIEAAQPADALACRRIRLGCDGAGVEHTHVGALGLGDDLASAGGEPAGEVCHLGEVDLAPEHGERDPQRTVEWRVMPVAARLPHRARRPRREPAMSPQPPRAGSAACAGQGER